VCTVLVRKALLGWTEWRIDEKARLISPQWSDKLEANPASAVDGSFLNP